MDYEKLHKETLERLQQIVREGKMTEEVAKYICPDLVAESEDERIRKAIVEHFEAFTPIKLFGERGTVTRDQVLAYLEKQKEQAADEKYAGMVVVSQEEWDAAIAEAFKIGRDEGERQRKQQPTELPKSEDYGIDGLYAAIDILQKTLGEVGGYQTDDGILEHKCAISAVKELYEQNLAEWSEEDEKMLASFLHKVEVCDLLTNKENVWIVKRLKSLRTQPKQEWSEEDKELLDALMDMVANSLYEPLCPRVDMLVWLRALRSRPKSSDNWKPSEEQMAALMDALRVSLSEPDMRIPYEPLSALYEQLKKL